MLGDFLNEFPRYLFWVKLGKERERKWPFLGNILIKYLMNIYIRVVFKLIFIRTVNLITFFTE